MVKWQYKSQLRLTWMIPIRVTTRNFLPLMEPEKFEEEEFFFKKVINLAESRASFHFKNGLTQVNYRCQRPEFSLFSMWRNCPPQPHPYRTNRCHCGSVVYPRSPSSSLSGRWLKSPAIWCPDFVTCPSEFICVSLSPGLGLTQEIFTATVCFSSSLHFPPKSCHSRPVAPPLCTFPSFLSLPTIGPHWEILVLITAAGCHGCGDHPPLVLAPQLWVCRESLTDFHRNRPTWWQHSECPSRNLTRLRHKQGSWSKFPIFFHFLLFYFSRPWLSFNSSVYASFPTRGGRQWWCGKNNACPLPRCRERCLLWLLKHEWGNDSETLSSKRKHSFKYMLFYNILWEDP